MNTPSKTGLQKKLSGAFTLLSSAVFLSLSLLAGKAKAQVADYVGTGGTSTSITYYSNETGTVLQKTGFGTASPCGSGGLSGMTNNGVTTYNPANAHVYFKVTPNSGYVINVTSFTAKLRRSGSGLTKVRFAYSLDNGATWTDDGVDHAPNNSSCGSSATTQTWGGGTLPTGVTATNGIIIALYPYDPISAGGVIQVNEVHIGGSVVASACSGTPSAGTASATPASLCGSGTTVLSLYGATSGTGITYQWAESSTSGGTYTDITGATTAPYTTGTISSTTYYKATVTCTTSGLSATTAYTTVSVTPTPTVAAITGTTGISTSSSTTLSNATTGGTWSSSNTGVATIGGTTGIVTSGVNSGTTTITYTVTSGSCTNFTTAVVTVLEPGTLAVYSGTGGNGLGTSVIAAQANETVGTLTAAGFGTNSPCGSGGFSGITVNTVYATYNAANPHIYYQILPASGYQLNVTDIKAVTRESSTGPQLARIAYSLDGGATWTDDATDHAQATGGGCGAASNIFSWTGGLTVTGITSTTNGIIVAVYPYNPTASTGAFQLHHLTVFGNVAPAGSCTGTTGGTAAGSPSFICGTGTSTVTLTGGSTGTGITYQWQSASSIGGTYTDISGATNTNYVASSLSATTFYQVVTTCAFGGSPSTSAIATVSVNPIPSAGTITGVPAYVYIGTPETLSNATTGGVWSSNHAGIATAGSASGIVTGLIPGTATIKYTVTVDGCSSFTTADVNVLYPNTIAAYLGTGGSSTSTIAFPGVSTTTLTATGFGTNSLCGSGGISGLTNDGVTTFSTSNANVYFQVFADPVRYFDVTGFHATLRRSNSGITKVRMAYSLDGGSTWSDDGIDQAPDNASCAQSATDYSYSASLPTGIIDGSSGVIFALYPYDPIANGGTIQVNSIDIVGTVSECVVAEEIFDGDIAICAGATAPLTGSPAGGVWSSSDAGVATVGTSGIVTGIASGVATITYTISNLCGETYVTTEMSVNPAPALDPITGVDEVCVNGNLPLFNSTAGGVWTSSTPGVATVGSSDGVVTGISVGTVEITYTVTNEFGCSAFVTATLNVVICGEKPGADRTVGVAVADGVRFYPNPASTMLFIEANEPVNVAVISVEGKTLIEQKNATSINVSGLAGGMYFIKVYNQANTLIKTARFSKNQ